MNGMQDRGATPAMFTTELFRSQMAELDEEEQELVWRWLRRARDGLPTPGVEKPWGGDWFLWPCGSPTRYRVLLRPMAREEVESLPGSPSEGFLLYSVESAAS